MPKRTTDYQGWLLDQLADPGVAANYVNAAVSDSPEMLLEAMRNVAEALRMAEVAKKAQVNRESLYRSLSCQGNPRLSTFTSVLNALGLQLKVEPLQPIEILTPSSPAVLAPSQEYPLGGTTTTDIGQMRTVAGPLTAGTILEGGAYLSVPPELLLRNEATTGRIYIGSSREIIQ
ncbi:MAG: addiction module antidote protein [Candidatus Acidiferrales bacterium]